MKHFLVWIIGLAMGFVSGVAFDDRILTPRPSSGEGAQVVTAPKVREVAGLQEELRIAHSRLAEFEKQTAAPTQAVAPAEAVKPPTEPEPDETVPAATPSSAEAWLKGVTYRELQDLEDRKALSLEQIRALLESSDDFQRNKGIGALLSVDDKSEAARLCAHMLETEPEHLNRGYAANILAQILGKDACPALARALTDPDDIVAGMAAQRLGIHGDSSYIPALETAAAREGLPFLKSAAATALAQLGDTRAQDEDIVRPAMQFLAGDDPGLRAMAVTALGRAEGRAHIGDIVQAIGDSDSSVRLAAIGVLRRKATAAEIGAVLGALTDASSEVRAEACAALAYQGTAAEIGSLQLLQSDPAEMVRFAAEEAIRRIQDPSIREPWPLDRRRR